MDAWTAASLSLLAVTDLYSSPCLEREAMALGLTNSSLESPAIFDPESFD
jgi:hypothetical protein